MNPFGREIQHGFGSQVDSYQENRPGFEDCRTCGDSDYVENMVAVEIKTGRWVETKYYCEACAPEVDDE